MSWGPIGARFEPCAVEAGIKVSFTGYRTNVKVIPGSKNK